MSESDGEQALASTGIYAYDLEPPSGRPATPVAWSPFRQPGQGPPRYAPPPLPEGFARVALDDDYYAGTVWSDWAGLDDTRPGRVFDIPAEQRERWGQAMAAYGAVQDEIEALLEARAQDGRLRDSRWVPEGWQRQAG